MLAEPRTDQYGHEWQHVFADAWAGRQFCIRCGARNTEPGRDKVCQYAAPRVEHDQVADAAPSELSSLRRVVAAAEDYRESRERWVNVYGTKDSTEDDRAVAFSTRDAMYDAFAAELIRHRLAFPHE